MNLMKSYHPASGYNLPTFLSGSFPFHCLKQKFKSVAVTLNLLERIFFETVALLTCIQPPSQECHCFLIKF